MWLFDHFADALVEFTQDHRIETLHFGVRKDRLLWDCPVRPLLPLNCAQEPAALVLGG